jgi:hypothetical protein
MLLETAASNERGTEQALANYHALFQGRRGNAGDPAREALA